jgi:hypothetical protein
MSEASRECLSVEAVDRDGALREAADRVGGPTRSAFLRKGALIGGGLVAGAIPLAIATGQGGVPKSDVAILNFALTLEYLEAAFYQQANASGALNGELATFASVVGAHENAHVAALQKALGSAATAKPQFDFMGTTDDKKKFAGTSQQLEDTGVSAYQGQAGRIKTPAVLLAAGSILPIEARHAAWIRDINGRGGSPVPAKSAFSKPLTMDQVLAAVKKTGFIKS